MYLKTHEPYDFGVSPVNLLERSPYTPITRIGLPPGYVPLSPVVWINGQATIRGVPLGTPQSVTGQTPTARADGQVTQGGATPIYNQGSFGDSSILVVNFTGAGLPVDAAGNPLLVVLPRPNNTRTLLLINNQTIAGPIFYNFDQVADNVASMQIAQGGSRNWSDTIPQGNLSLFANGAGTVLIEYMNNNVSI